VTKQPGAASLRVERSDQAIRQLPLVSFVAYGQDASRVSEHRVQERHQGLPKFSCRSENQIRL
jgi:hypothetical protein